MRFSIRKPVTVMSICSLALAGTALAGGGKQHSGVGAFKMMDTNNDGKISATEHGTGAKKMFEMMDANKDGKVTVEEMEAAQTAMMGKARGTTSTAMGDKTIPETADKPVTEKGPMDKTGHMMSAADKIKVVDTDGDGVLSAQEHEAGARSMFEKMDTDKDGNLTKNEMTAGHNKMMTKPAK
jgi:Ca2+-binding EF-hand superfamily protein